VRPASSDHFGVQASRARAFPESRY
jgi:hypothetical protein